MLHESSRSLSKFHPVKMSRIPQIQTRSKIARPTSGKQASITATHDVAPGSANTVGRVEASDENFEAPSLLQKNVFKKALATLARDPGQTAQSVGTAKSVVPRPIVSTKRGKEPVVQQMQLQTTVQRTPMAEYIGKTMVGIDVDSSGTARKVEMTSQQIDPTHGTESAGVNETLSATSSLSVTAKGRLLKKSYKKRTVISDKLASKANINPHHVSRLVIEEIEDVENTLKMVPPELTSTSIKKYPMKKKLQSLRITSEPVSILTQSVINPTPTADEVETEAPPEVLASVIEAVEKGATPDSAPNQIFNSLFPEVHEERIHVSSVARGPLEDIVVPTDKPRRLVEEVLSQEMEDTITAAVQGNQELPKDDICSENNITPVTSSPPRESKKILLEGELPPWEDFSIQKVSSLVGGDPIDILDISDLSVLSPGDVSQELSKGIDYFIDANVVPYETKIQIRGSKHPSWFPGYMSALPHLPGLVKLSKCPHEVLQAAWKAAQPKTFPDESILIV